jgi:hypothetical protein
MLIMSCDDNTSIGLGGDSASTPKNIFDGGEWEVIEYNTDKIHYYKKLSFTKNTFTFYEKQGYSPYQELAYTGTYRLFFYGEYKREMIEFISDEPSMNGAAMYYHDFGKPNGEKYPDGTIRILGFPGYDNLNGIYPKIN